MLLEPGVQESLLQLYHLGWWSYDQLLLVFDCYNILSLLHPATEQSLFGEGWGLHLSLCVRICVIVILGCQSATNTWFCFSQSQNPPVWESRNTKGNSSTLITTSDPLEKISIPVPTTIRAVGLKVLISEWESALARSHNKHSIKLEVHTYPDHLGLLMPLSQQAKREISVSGGSRSRLSWVNWFASPQWR